MSTYTFIPDIIARFQELLTDDAQALKRISKLPLHTEKQAKVMAFSFAAGQEMKEHSTTKQAILFFVSGAGEVTPGEELVKVKAGSWIHMPPLLPHKIKANESTIMLLIQFPASENHHIERQHG